VNTMSDDTVQMVARCTGRQFPAPGGGFIEQSPPCGYERPSEYRCLRGLGGLRAYPEGNCPTCDGWLIAHEPDIIVPS